MAKVVLGIYREKVDAENAIERLRDLDYNPNDFTVLIKELHRDKNPGDISDELMGFGLPEKDVKVYEIEIIKGGILLAVPARSGGEREVEVIFSDTDAELIKIITNIRSDDQDEQFEEQDEDTGYRNRQPLYAYRTVKGGKSVKTKRTFIGKRSKSS